MTSPHEEQPGQGGVPDIGLLVREYEPLREVGRGGMGTVVLAQHRMARHRVAIKVSAPGTLARQESMLRLSREAKVLASLRHPNIVRLYDVVDIGRGRYAIVMEYVQGDSLSHVIAEHGPLPIDRVRAILGDLAGALEHAHARGVVHRDIKPANVLVHLDSWAAKLCDFGIARGSTDSGDVVTASGVVAGTPAYMAPEAIDGKPLDPRSDIYGLALLGWEMLTGQQPWRGLPLFDVLYHQKHVDLPNVAELRRDISPGIVLAIEGAMAKEPQLRWSHAREFLEQLERDDPTERLITLRADRRAVAEGNLEVDRDFTLDLPIVPFVSDEVRERYPAIVPSHASLEPVVVPEPAAFPAATLDSTSARDGRDDARGEQPDAVPVGWRSAFRGQRALVLASTAALACLTVLIATVSMLGPSRGGGAVPVSRSPRVVDVPQEREAAERAPDVPTSPAAGEQREEVAPVAAAALEPSRPTLPGPFPRAERAGDARNAIVGALSSESRGGSMSARPSHEASGDVANPERARFEVVVREAKRLEREGRLHEAERTLDQALRASPRRGELYAIRAHVRAAHGAVRNAWTDLEMAQRMGEGWAVLALETRLIAERDGRAAAREHVNPELRAALEPPRMLDPDRAFGIARALVVLGDRATALTVLERTRAPDAASLERFDDPLLASLATEPRVIALRRRLAGGAF